MKILVAGAGLWGREHLRCLAAIGGLTLAVADKRLDAATAAASEFGCAAAGADADAMLKGFQPDGLVIATPTTAHLSLGLLALERNIAVLVEKPVAATAAECRRLHDAAQRSKAFLLPGHVLRFSPQHQMLARIVEDGRIGKVLAINSQRYRGVDHVARFKDIDAVLATMIHDIDLALWLGGSTAASSRAVRRPANSTQSITIADVTDHAGILWRLTTGWLHPSSSVPPDHVEIVGTTGSVVLKPGAQIDVFGPDAEHMALAVEDSLALEVATFVRAVQQGVAPQEVRSSDAVNGLVAAEMILAGLEAQQ